MAIKYCTNSTITEAWALIAGFPGPIDTTEDDVIYRVARGEMRDLQEKPAVVAVEATGSVPPFWNRQVSWDGGRYLARFGHRYLSVHFVRQSSDRYGTFSDTLLPPLRTWVDVYSRAVGSVAAEQRVGMVGFGYVNSFTFGPENFDLSKYFRLNMGIGVRIADGSLMAIETGCKWHDESRRMTLALRLDAESGSPAEPAIRVVTKVHAENQALTSSFAEGDVLLAAITAAKEAAKATFFEFATSATHGMMGAVEDAQG